MFSGNSSNLKTHLYRHHAVQYDALIAENENKCNDVDVELRSNQGSSSDERNTVCSSKKPKLQQSSLDFYSNSKNKYPANSSIAKSLTDKLAIMIAKDMQPLSVVENVGFINFQQALNPRYIMPTRKSIRVSIENLYEVLKNKLSLQLQTVNTDVHLTTDMWTDTNKFISYMAVTCHYIDDDFKLQRYTLQTKDFSEKHTAQNIKKALIDCCNNWKITDKIKSVTTDNGSNVVAAVKEVSTWWHYPCYAHTLNLIVTDGIKVVNTAKVNTNKETIQQLLQKCREIVHLFKSSTHAASELRKEQEAQGKKALSVKKEVVTRWNSTLIMLDSIFKLKDVLTVVVSKINVEQNKTVPILIFQEYELIFQLLQVLKPFDIATSEMSTELYLSSSKIIPVTKCLINQLNCVDKRNNFDPCVTQLKKQLLSSIESRMGLYEKNLQYGSMTYLDPRFKNLFCNPELTLKIKTHLINDIKKIPYSEPNGEIECSSQPEPEATNKEQEDDSDNFWAYVDKKVNCSRRTENSGDYVQFKIYEELPILSRESDPLEWWRTNKEKFPKLAILAKNYLAKPATSVPSERVFSKSGELLNKKRCQLSPDIVNKLIFLNMNV